MCVCVYRVYVWCCVLCVCTEPNADLMLARQVTGVLQHHDNIPGTSNVDAVCFISNHNLISLTFTSNQPNLKYILFCNLYHPSSLASIMSNDLCTMIFNAY